MLVYWSVPSMSAMFTWFCFSSCCSWVYATWIDWLVVSTTPKNISVRIILWLNQLKTSNQNAMWNIYCASSLPPKKQKTRGTVLKTKIDPCCGSIGTPSEARTKRRIHYRKTMENHGQPQIQTCSFPKNVFGLWIVVTSCCIFSEQSSQHYRLYSSQWKSSSQEHL